MAVDPYPRGRPPGHAGQWYQRRRYPDDDGGQSSPDPRGLCALLIVVDPRPLPAPMTETTLIFDDGPVYGPLATPEGYRQWVRDDEPVVGGPTQAPLPTAGPLISVVVPVYRPLPWSFQRCLESVM